MALKLNMVLVDFHVGARGGKEVPPRLLNAVFIPDTASRSMRVVVA
jgi:hypothetical protein